MFKLDLEKAEEPEIKSVIMGGVLSALFAAFLVTLFICGMKKKNKGTYTLEEPNQASVTYQKPNKQEEFYA
uniref:Syndecan/Neurexin domain-containing protein n=1 Tax=Bos indicus x Bos taurus TaxID=30522 RepID=A0A4W2DHQ7_BOBOX